jgi:hypothetical protein
MNGTAAGAQPADVSTPDLVNRRHSPLVEFADERDCAGSDEKRATRLAGRRARPIRFRDALSSAGQSPCRSDMPVCVEATDM